MYATNEKDDYDDERVATENYYLENKEDGQKLFQKADGDAHAQSANQIERTKTGANPKKDVDAGVVLHAFETDTDGYYRTVKTEIDELLKSYPRDDTLKGAFSCSEWVRVKGSKHAPEYLVGVVYFNGKARYICYALAAQNKNEPPEEIKNVCSFVPLSPFDENKGFFVIFQSAATGECVKPQKV